MIIVTGGAGFIGSNLVKGLNNIGQKDIWIVDDLTEGHKFFNLVDLDYQDYLDKDTFISLLEQNKNLNIEGIFHQGACSVTTEWNGRYMMENNYEYSKKILHYCLARNIPLWYASSAAVYGREPTSTETITGLKPLNIYGYSKYLFDQYMTKHLNHATASMVGLRYFNVYGPNEAHKGSMASVAFHFHHQILETGIVKLFEGCEGYTNGEQRRDFIYVEDVVNVNLWLYQNPDIKGIFNVGTGKSQSFNEVARAVIQGHGKGQIEYIPFPKHLEGKYQSFTEADISALRKAGYDFEFKSVEVGIQDYLKRLKSA